MPDKPTMRIRSLMLHGTELSYVREILTVNKASDDTVIKQWQRHDNEVLTKEQAEELAKANGWKIVDEQADAFEAGVKPAESKPD